MDKTYCTLYIVTLHLNDVDYRACRDQWLRYRFGVFDEASYSPSEVGSEQHSLCYGKSVIDVVAAHPDIQERYSVIS